MSEEDIMDFIKLSVASNGTPLTDEVSAFDVFMGSIRHFICVFLLREVNARLITFKAVLMLLSMGFMYNYVNVKFFANIYYK